MSDDKFTQSFDARDWAKAFLAHTAIKPSIAASEETMTGWFANALMRGYDEATHRLALTEVEARLDELSHVPILMGNPVVYRFVRDRGQELERELEGMK